MMTGIQKRIDLTLNGTSVIVRIIIWLTPILIAAGGMAWQINTNSANITRMDNNVTQLEERIGREYVRREVVESELKALRTEVTILNGYTKELNAEICKLREYLLANKGK